MLFSCKNDMEEVNRVANDEILPEMTGHNLEMIYSDSARIKYKVITPEYLKMSEGEEKYEEFPQGLHAISYDTDGKEIGSITCKYAKKLEEEQLWEARNEVVVINSEGKKLETELLASTDSKETGSRIQELRHRYLQLKQTVLPLREQYARILHSDSELFHKSVRPFLNDVNDHLQYAAQQIDLCRETLASLVDLYISNNDLRMNAIMKRLTIVSTIFIPLTFLVGVWGMNFRRMPELEWKYGDDLGGF